jgi:hypothetical protein
MSNSECAVVDEDNFGEKELNKFFNFGGSSSPSGSSSSSFNDTPSLTFLDICGALCGALGLSYQEVSEIEKDWENPLPMNYEEDELLDKSGYNLEQSPDDSADDSAVDNPLFKEIIESLQSDVNDITSTISLEEIVKGWSSTTPTISLEEIVKGWSASNSTCPTTVAHPLFGMDPDIPCHVDMLPIPDLPRSKTPETTKSVSKPVFFSAKTVPEDRKRKHEQVETNSADDLNAKRKKVGAYTHEERRAKIAEWMAKRPFRIWMKRVEYNVRKNFADSRLRVKGRFVKKEDEDLLRELLNMS